ncbi:MAG: hypothetical protein GX443_13745 [Deltaproteobacteria bacterium]|nr:hypothetical protein [Deltaproteobacteria bacterium]
MGDAAAAFELLMSECHEKIESFAHRLNHYNARRQMEEGCVLEEVRRRCALRPTGARTLVLADPGWAPGIVGLVGSRVVREIHHGPAVILSVDEEQGIARGSARSIPGFDMHRALEECSDLLLRWGGHKMAAGLSLSLECLESFSRRLERIALHYPSHVFSPKGKVDLELKLDLVSEELWQALEQMEPFGVGNPPPLFAAKRIPVCSLGSFGKEGKHLRLSLGANTDALYWGGTAHWKQEKWPEKASLDVVFRVEWDHFKGKPCVIVKDLGTLF